jgi:hypothetical protein
MFVHVKVFHKMTSSSKLDLFQATSVLLYVIVTVMKVICCDACINNMSDKCLSVKRFSTITRGTGSKNQSSDDKHRIERIV